MTNLRIFAYEKNIYTPELIKKNIDSIRKSAEE
jgi:hypothetical protein